MSVDPRKVATFMFQHNYFRSGLDAPAATAKMLTPPKAISPATVIDKSALTADAAPADLDAQIERIAATPSRRSTH